MTEYDEIEALVDSKKSLRELKGLLNDVAFAMISSDVSEQVELSALASPHFLLALASVQAAATQLEIAAVHFDKDVA